MLLSPKATLFSVVMSQAARRHLPQCQTDVHWCANVNLSFAAEDAFLAGQIKSRRTATVISQQDAHSPIILLQISLRLQVVPGMICTLCNYRNKREKGIVNGTMTARLSRGGRNIIIFIWQLNCIFSAGLMETINQPHQMMKLKSRWKTIPGTFHYRFFTISTDVKP